MATNLHRQNKGMMMRELPLGKIMVSIVVVVLAMAYARERTRAREALIQAHNLQASLDTSRVILRDSTGTLTERLAFQQSREIELSRDMDRLLRADGSRVQMLARLRLELDSVRGAVTRGAVTEDSAIRYFASRLDTLGFRVGIKASVPAPPESASVEWNVAHEPESVIVALNRTEEGQLALRALTGPNATARVDTTVVRIESAARHNASLAGKLLLVLGGVVIGVLLK